MGKKVQQQYVVKEIVDRRDEKLPNGKSQTLYKVIWLGYPESQATWQNSRKLMRHPELKKDIQLFNEKRKNIIKQAKNQGKNKKSKNSSLSLSIDHQAPIKSSIVKKISEPATALKLIRNEIAKPNITISKQPKQKNDQVVGEILSKIRDNVNLINSKTLTPRKKDPIIIEQTDKKIMSKVKEKLSTLKEQKAQKKHTKKPESDGQKIFSLDNIFPEPKIKLTEKAPDSKQLESIIEEHKESNLKNSIILSGKPSNSSLDKTIQMRSQENSQQKLAQEKGNGIIDKIKLQLTEELIVKEAPSKSKVNEPVEPLKDEEFEIKGMIMCKNEYFYLVEENGKSQILSRAEILNTHPYELIVFYEKRINIKPAQINMMIL